MIPGELILKKEDIICNAKKKTERIEVKNTGDRPIQVGSHFHFFEVNKALDFDRNRSFGMRLNIPASTAVRFEPGEKKMVILVEIGGKKNIYGFNNLTDGNASENSVKTAAIAKAKKNNFKGAK
ncbi:urease subunit beta [Chitinophaga qingshengii]|uniref:Urease subunit beta n=1 Tax=Chitinophaga qingshengii TaxID=1569794 RepID=A0ABR7TSQ4_9BACT|nr:urease subunit beta [Chitinophaga qingshengii]MBC9933511.1 urease subunit beta [Chitinophaga qingshengii]